MPTLKYVQPEELTTILTQDEQAVLTDDLSHLQDVEADANIILTYLRYAESTAEGYIQTRYTTPLVEPPMAFIYAVLVIAKYRLLLRRQYLSEAARQEYDDVMGWLRRVQAEDADLYERANMDDDETRYGTSRNTHFDSDFFL